MSANGCCDYYDDPEFDYQDYWQGRDYEDQAERQILRSWYPAIGKQEWIVDLGGGFGRLANEYQPWADRALLVEPSTKIIHEAKTRNNPKLYLLQSTAENLCLHPQSVDVVQMVRVAHHCQDLPLALEKIYRALKSPGWLILEFPNKINGLMTFRNWLRGNFRFRQNLTSIDRRADQRQREEVIPFMNHHPEQVINWLSQTGFVVKKFYSVSNLRRLNFIPTKWALGLDKWFWKLGAKIWWGPSIFVLAKKEENKRETPTS